MEDMGCLPLILIVTAVSIALIVMILQARWNAQQAYLESLEQLKHNPADPHLRQETLRLGRIYASKVRSSGRVAVFDEVALMNDINAACAAVSVARPLQAATPPSSSIESRLARLADLKNQGHISEAEYAERRRQILNEV